MPQQRTEAPASTAAKRCVIYCRKSSSKGLDRNYTSIDAQRDTCLRFIENHASDGWQYTGQVFEDGGFSSGTTDRPAFQRMMRDARAAGRWAAASTPYGYRKNADSELVVDEENAERIRFIFERYPVIKSVRQVTIELNDHFGDKEPAPIRKNRAYGA